MNDVEMFKEELPSKEKFYSFLTDRKISDKEYEHDFNVLKKFEMKTKKDYHDFKMWRFIISWCDCKIQK